NTEQKNREEMMSRLSEISFALNDLTLYLDTHPDCQNGLAMYHKLMKERLDLLADFAGNFYPVTQASAITGECDETIYGWGEGPAPWEGACL
ncbi:MAG: spore coat protein CotJB, partial [Lachnospiraceae bacterium]|nr:spore coat protein CotJB [Lachnospiraceae bacterium]